MFSLLQTRGCAVFPLFTDEFVLLWRLHLFGWQPLTTDAFPLKTFLKNVQVHFPLTCMVVFTTLFDSRQLTGDYLAGKLQQDLLGGGAAAQNPPQTMKKPQGVSMKMAVNCCGVAPMDSSVFICKNVVAS